MTHEATITKALFQNVLHGRNHDKTWSPSRQMVSNVFNAYPNRALTAKQVTLVCKAVECLADVPENDQYVQDALTFFVRQKVLRSRLGDNGQRLYEVNF